MVAKVKPAVRRGRSSHERLFTVEDYHRMADAGVFRSGERVELLEGRVIVMAAQNTPHAAAVAGESIVPLAAPKRRKVRVADMLP